LQRKLGIEADGEFGPNTEKALKDWQTKNGLSADGCSNKGRAAMRSRSYRKS
jgi:peptidoglycan hydrolase-like protein with peptidoglycan-binding domain